MKPEGERYTVAVDFDGVIHSYTSPWAGPDVIPDPPVEGAMEWLQEMMEHFEMVIFTTRAKTLAGRWAVRRYIEENADWPEALSLRVTSEKIPALMYIDDRGWRFEGPGTFPTRQQIHQALPWNKRRAHA